MSVSIEHPTDRPNFSIVRIGDASLAFSYSTLVGVATNYSNWKVTRNYWGATTGKHLNYLNPNHDERLTADDFAELVASLEVTVKVSE